MSVFRVPDSSIILPAGTELHFKLTEALVVKPGFPPQYPELIDTEAKRSAFAELVRPLPFRTTTQGEGNPSDLTSLLYTGSKDAVERAFLAAGWVRSDQLDANSTYGVMRSVIENQGYRSAPMSVLLLDGKEPELTFAKTLNTFFSRHHLRIYEQAATYEGQPVWTSTATYDSGIGFSKAAKTFIHMINENIDEERTKVVNDLILTGCVDSVGYLERPWVPRDAKNATGDSLLTDGSIAIVKLNSCATPVRADKSAEDLPKVAERQSAMIRPFRTVFLTLRNDFTRGNIVYQGYSGARIGISALRKPKAATADDAPRTVHYGGQEFAIVAGSAPTKSKDRPADPGRQLDEELDKRRPHTFASQLMFSIGGGLVGYGQPRFSTQPMLFSVFDADGIERLRSELDFETRLDRGWSINPRVTLNSWKYVSGEFSYARMSTNFRVSGREPLTGLWFDERSKALVRQVAYNVLIHARPNGKRFRPFLAVGPAFQLVHLDEAKPQQNSLLKFAARDVSLFLTAYNFGSKPPLEGGGIFQFGFNYGGGATINLTRRVFLRADFRETLSAQPDFWSKSVQKLTDGLDVEDVKVSALPLVKHGPLRVQNVTIGIGISF